MSAPPDLEAHEGRSVDPADLPVEESGISRAPATPSLGHRLEVMAFRGLGAGLRALPEPVATLAGSFLGALMGSVLRVRRRAVDAHLAIAFPEARPSWRGRVARASYRHVGREAVALLRLSRRTAAEVAERTHMVGFESLREAVSRGGAIGITGHLGNWEVAGASVAAHGVPIDAVAKGMGNPLFGDELTAMRRRLGMEVVDMEEAPREVLRNLRRGGRFQGLLADQNVHRGGIFVPFFGKPAATVRGPALFALRTGAPIFLVWALREPGLRERYRVAFVPVPYERTGDLEADTRAITLAYTRALEAEIREAPEQYFWLHKRWKKRPPEESSA